MTRHLETLSAALSSSQSLTSSMHEPVSRGWRDGRDTGGSGKKTLLLELWRRSSHITMLGNCLKDTRKE
jgi:hypothetical protein